MRNPKKILNGSVGRLRRPSAAMMVAIAALFLSLGGASYAAVALPSASVGAAQLKTFAVTNPKLATNAVGSRKIMPGAVGFYRVNKNEVQLRVNGTCSTGQAMTSVGVSGSVTCAGTSPTEIDSGASTNTTIPTGTTATSIATKALAGGTAYLVQATPTVEVSGTGLSGNHVTVTCTLAAGPSTTATVTRSQTINVDAAGDTEYASLPLSVTAPSSANAITASLGCTQTAATPGAGVTGTPTVQAQATIYALGVNQSTTTTPAS
jgi:hypothetical protein